VEERQRMLEEERKKRKQFQDLGRKMLGSFFYSVEIWDYSVSLKRHSLEEKRMMEVFEKTCFLLDLLFPFIINLSIFFIWYPLSGLFPFPFLFFFH
jgi:hypothetical protein